MNGRKCPLCDCTVLRPGKPIFKEDFNHVQYFRCLDCDHLFSLPLINYPKAKIAKKVRSTKAHKDLETVASDPDANRMGRFYTTGS